jgi:hypothetical protein
VAPPCIITVIITINEVVVNIACRASDTVFRIANAKDIAPRKPAQIKNATKYNVTNKKRDTRLRNDVLLKLQQISLCIVNPVTNFFVSIQKEDSVVNILFSSEKPFVTN